MQLSRCVVLVSAVALVGCGGGQSGAPGQTAAAATTVTLDGSSTVFPISEAVAEEFQKTAPGVRVTVGISGTGGGFQKFCRGETDISNASRPITATESAACAAAGITFIEMPVAYDGLAVVANPKATWIDHLTVAELKTMWAPEAQGKVMRWSHIRSGWPDRELHLFGAGVDSGTYDYFTQAIVGTEGASRGDFTSSEDDNVLVQGIANDELAIGFMPYAYYIENKDTLKLIAVDDGKTDNGAGPISPSVESVKTGTYQPLSRPVFIYASVPALARPEVVQFVNYYLTEGSALAEEVGYVPLGERGDQLVQAHFAARTPGSVFEHAGSQVGLTIDQLLQHETK
ncbi:MAG TPA: PstS family phosphate ABC transporter substrate-binding protein [Vicinamibacterales bacterium]|nr:PstS family phosphate ABC transporter substrate-binding protein [Vicinamibacterales bacterium]